MLELTFSFDAPLEANRVSSEDTQAQLDEFRQMPWIKPDYKAVTLDALRKVERYWRQYSPSTLRLQSGVCSGRISFADRGRYCTYIQVDHKATLLSEESSMYMTFCFPKSNSNHRYSGPGTFSNNNQVDKLHLDYFDIC
jgi:hypothetical protein